MTRINKIKKERPDLVEDPTVVAAAEDVDTQGALAAFNRSEAGDIVRKSLLENVAGAVDALSSNWRTASHQELMALCARLEDRIALLKTLSRAQSLKEAAEQALQEMTS
jgi:hypothetical protein